MLKICNTCQRELPDTPKYFVPRLKAGGIWGTTAKCRKCMNERLTENRLIRKIEKKLAEQKVAAL
jgi:hypothetical protein